MKPEQPSVVLVGGPNGAGKSTAAPKLIRDSLGLTEFINADTIAHGFSFEPERVSVTAGKLMLKRMKELHSQGKSFAFETTLASRLFASLLKTMKADGYRIHLFFFWLPSPDFAIARVASRIKMGGHSVPEDVIRRRYISGLKNFFSLYQPVCDIWRMYNSTLMSGPTLIARGKGIRAVKIEQSDIWSKLRKGV